MYICVYIHIHATGTLFEDVVGAWPAIMKPDCMLQIRSRRLFAGQTVIVLV